MIRRGFTVIELILVISIAAILLTLSIVNLRSSQANARDAERKTDVETIAQHLENYYTSGTDDSTVVGSYPSTDLTTSAVKMKEFLRDIDDKTLVAPGITDPTDTFISASETDPAGDPQPVTIATVLPQPTIGQYVYQPLTSSGELCTTGSSVAEVLVVGGGGGGGSYYGGGGGAGELYYTANKSLTAQQYTVTVGAGGAGASTGSPDGAKGLDGGSSVFGDITVSGGGGGGHALNAGNSIGSGGGGGGNGTNAGGTATLLQEKGHGYNGAAGEVSSAGGGGGAGATGSGANGGIGLSYNISGTGTYYAGGGGGWDTGVGGSDIGGNYGYSASANTGSGGGAWNNVTAGAGGSGIIIIRYLTGSITATGGTITNVGPYTIHTFTASGTFAVTANVPECTKFNLYYRSEVDNVVHVIKSKNR